MTAHRTLTFSDCAHLAMSSLPAPEAIAPNGRSVIIAHSAIDTIIAIYRALELITPVALLHPRLSGDELSRQRNAVYAAELTRDVAFVLFTSGSTSAPRGVVLSREAIVSAAAASASGLGWRDDDRWLLCLPLAHAGGLSIVVRCLMARKPIVFHDAAFDAERVHALASAQRATLASLVPTQLDRFTNCPQYLRAALLGGAAATPAQLTAALATGWPIRSTYGMTESFGQIATATEPGALPRVLPGVTIIAGETLRVRGPMLATAYLDGAAIAPEFTTRDIGSIDDGFVRILGRSDDMIITGGEKIHPLTVEAVLAATPGIRAACAFSLPDPQWGHIVAAALVIDDNFDRSIALASWHTALAPHARPRRLALVSALPTLPSGKLDRHAIAALPTTSVDYRPS